MNWVVGLRREETISGSWVAVGPMIVSGTVVPKYLVLSVIYAPPGTNGGRSTSSVSYESGSTTGTTVSVSHSFKTTNGLSFQGSAGILGSGGGVGVSFDYSATTGDTQSVDIKKSTSTIVSRNGPSQDGVNHDEDLIYLLLKPKLALGLSSSLVTWDFDASGSSIQYVYAGWLNGHTAMPQNVANALMRAGIAPADYAMILSRDALATQDPAGLDTRRFIPLNVSFPYEPPYLSTDPVPTMTFKVSNTTAVSSGTSFEDAYKVGSSVSGSGSFIGLATAKLTETNSWEWSNKSSTVVSGGDSQTASLTVGGPAFGYQGPTLMAIYYDTLYKTFAFVPSTTSGYNATLQGVVMDRSGNPRIGAEVTLQDAAGAKYTTFTDAHGTFKFNVNANGPATVRAGGTTKIVPQARSVGATVKVDFQ